MDNKILSKVALRFKAVFLNIDRKVINLNSSITEPVLAFIKRLNENGFCVNEELLHALNAVNVKHLTEITEIIDEVMGVKLNWAPLVKGWDTPTGESLPDHLITLIANMFGNQSVYKGTRLQCGHLIPEGTFPLERYNGCPFCGQQFETANFVYKGQGSKLKELRLFTINDIQKVYLSLLNSPTPLDGTQKDTLQLLLGELPLPENAEVTMKETIMLVIKVLAEKGDYSFGDKMLKNPADILRYLWYDKTGYTQIIEPKTLISHSRKIYSHIFGPLDKGADAALAMKEKLRLKYSRKFCLQVARWLNAVPITATQAAEIMNPKRGMWVRFIRALRLGEYARKKGMEHLRDILDVFYRKDYTTWQGKLNKAINADDGTTTLKMLQQRPGLFARCLFATMLRFGKDVTLDAFNQISDNLPARLLISLGNAAESYFNTDLDRVVRPIIGTPKRIDHNIILTLYNDTDRNEMASAVDKIYQQSMARRFAAQKTESKTIYIDPTLYNIPVSVGDRSATIQDTSCALTGTRFPVEGDAVRLFLQWGKGLPAQWLDMDLSCRISLPNNEKAECAYYNLTCVGAKHSGDIQQIPDMVGTAEYIELSLPELDKAGAKYVTFTCNAYSNGALSPNLVVGWMNSKYPMKVSNEKGVAYDPSCVQHQVRISEGNLSKGLVFGVLDIAKREIIWLEMPFTAQTLRGADSKSVAALLHRLETKLSIGGLLEIKAKAQNLTIVDTPDTADESYTYQWALNPAEVAGIINI